MRSSSLLARGRTCNGIHGRRRYSAKNRVESAIRSEISSSCRSQHRSAVTRVAYWMRAVAIAVLPGAGDLLFTRSGDPNRHGLRFTLRRIERPCSGMRSLPVQTDAIFRGHAGLCVRSRKKRCQPCKTTHPPRATRSPRNPAPRTKA